MNKLLVISFCFLLLACGKDDIVVTDTDTTIAAWLDSAGVTTATRDDNGIYVIPEVTNGSGSVVVSSGVVAIYYNLYDLDSNLVAQHQSANGDSLIFKHGASAVYPIGLDVGVGYMRVGETYSFILPPAYAYSDLTSGGLDEDGIYWLQVEVVGLFNEDDLFTQEITDITDYVTTNKIDSLPINPVDSTVFFTSGIGYKRKSIGSGTQPLNGDTIIVDYQGSFLDGSGNFDSKSAFQWIYGSNQPRELLAGFEFGVTQMQTGEDALLFIPSSQGYRESALVVPASITDDLIIDAVVPDYVAKVPPYKTLIFDITRVD